MAGGMAACWAKTHPILNKHMLPIGLTLAIIIALGIPQIGIAVGSLRVEGWGIVQTICVVLIFICSGLSLKTDDILKAIRAYRASLFGVVSILFITPLLALVPGELPFLPLEFQIGFLLFCSMPTTINSGVALVGSAKGNQALALLLTVSSNLLGIFTVPFFLSLLLAVGDISIDPTPLLTKLLLLILLPLVVGKVARDQIPAVLRFVKKAKAKGNALTNFSNFCLILIPWMKLSASQSALAGLSAPEVIGLLGCGLVIHAVYLGFNFGMATLLRLPLPEKKSVVVMGSQKTLPMAMTVLTFLPPSFGEPGLIAIPCILSHLTQIFVDAAICSKWAQVTDKPAAASGSESPKWVATEGSGAQGNAAPPEAELASAAEIGEART